MQTLKNLNTMGIYFSSYFVLDIQPDIETVCQAEGAVLKTNCFKKGSPHSDSFSKFKAGGKMAF